MSVSTAQSSIRPADKLPPFDIEAEQALLGSMYLDPSFRVEVRSNIRPEHFYDPENGALFGAMCAIDDRNEPLDWLTLKREIERRKMGGVDAAYLARVIDSVPSSAHGQHYATVVRGKWALRQVIVAAEEATRQAMDPFSGLDAAAIGQRMLDSVSHIAAGSHAESVVSLGELLGDVFNQLETGELPNVTTGFDAIDTHIGRPLLGEVWLIGARPSMGKSTLAKQIAVRAAKAGEPAAIISLEEGKHKIGRNIFAAEAQVENKRLRQPKTLGPQDWVEITSAMARLGETPLYITDRPRKLADIRAMVSLLKAKHGVKLVVIDYLQLVQAPGNSPYEKASEASKGIATMCRDLGVAAIVPVQINRRVEQAEDKRPSMGDLRDSGQIEQDADVILFLHREDYYRTADKTHNPTQEAELIVAKYRDGTRGAVVKLRSNLKFQTFEDMIQDPF